MDSAHGAEEAESIDADQPAVQDYDVRWAALIARSEVVFRVLIADIGVDGWDVALSPRRKPSTMATRACPSKTAKGF